MALLHLLSAGCAADGDYSALSSPSSPLSLALSSHRAVRVTDIDGNGRKWIELPASDNLGIRAESYAFTSSTELTLGIRVRRGSMDADDVMGIVSLLESAGGSAVFTVRVKNNGKIQIRQFTDSTIVYDGDSHGSIAALPNLGDEAYIEVHWKRNGTGGAGTSTFDVWINDVFDGTHTQSTGFGYNAVTVAQWAWGANTSDDAFKTGWKLADGYVDSTTRWEPCHVCYKPASVAGDLAESTPTGAGSIQACVDELGAPTDTDYALLDGASGAMQDALGHAGVGAPALTLHPAVMARRTGTAGQLFVGIRSDGVDQFSTTPGNPSTAYGRFRGLTDVQLDPATGLPWDFAGTEDLQISYKAPQMFSLSRTSGSGLLARYEFDNASFPFSTANWSAPSQVTLSISSSKLRCAGTASASNRFIRNTAVSSQSEMMVFCRAVRSTGAQMGVGVLVSDNDPSSKDGIEASCAGGFSGGRFLIEWVANASTTIDSTGSGINNSSPQQTSAWANATDAAMRDHNNGANESGTYSPAQSGTGAVYLSTTASINVDVEKWFAFTGRYLTVTGLVPGSGQKAKIRTSGGTELVSATESGGTAVIDCMFIAAWQTVDHIQIVDANDFELGRSSGTTPWAGETWAASGTSMPLRVTQAGLFILRALSAPPNTPTISGAPDGAFEVDVEGSVYSHSQGVPIDAAIWESADDEDFTTGVEQEIDTSPGSPPSFAWPVAGGSNRWYRVAYRDANLSVSDYSDPIQVATPNPPDKPTVSVVATGPRSFDETVSTYSHPDNTPIASVIFRRATNAGMSIGLEVVQIDYASPVDVPDPLVYPWGDPATPSSTWWVDAAYIDEDGVQGEFADAESVTTEAEIKPNTPSILTAGPGVDGVSLISSAFSDPEGRTHVKTRWQVALASDPANPDGSYQNPINENLEDVDGLTTESMLGLPAGTALKAHVLYVADDGAESFWSANKLFSTLTAPVNRPQQPTVSWSSVTTSSGLLSSSAYVNPTGSPHKRTQWYVTDYPGGGTFGLAYRFLDVQSTTDLTSRSVTGMTQNKLYNGACRHQALDGSWSDWSPWSPVTTAAAPLLGDLLQITFPRQGMPVRGSAVQIAWTPASSSGDTFEIQWSNDWQTWTTIAVGITSSPYSWNTLMGTVDGVAIVRVRAKRGSLVSEWQYRILVIDNANQQASDRIFNYNAEAGTSLPDWVQAWYETGVTWDIGGSGDVRMRGPGQQNFEAAFSWLPPFEPNAVDVIGEVMIASRGGSFPWQWFPEQTWRGVGVFAEGGVTGEGPENGVAATIYALPISAFGDCETRGSGDGFLELAAYENGRRIFTTVVSIGRVHVLNTFSGCNKVPRYGVRLRVTTIQLLSGGRRKLRLQASVTGRGVSVPGDGWHHEAIVETSLSCGRACLVGRQITSTRDPWGSFTSLTVIPYDYGTCSQPAGFPNPSTPLQDCPRPELRVTIFDNDDATPIWGSVDSYGAVIEPSFSTDKDHPRPYVLAWGRTARHEVDLIGGKSSIGGFTCELLDKRVDPCDDQSGFLTSYAGDANGFSRYIGRRLLAEELLADGSSQIVHNGPIKDIALIGDGNWVTWRFSCASMRERERKVPLFNTQALSWSAYPYGPTNGYGNVGPTEGADQFWLMPPAEIATGTYQQFSGTAGITVGRIVNQSINQFAVNAKMAEELGVPTLVADDAGFIRRVWTNFVIRWRRPGEGDDDWTYVENMPAAAPSAALSGWQAFKVVEVPNVFQILFDWPGLALQYTALTALDEDAAELLPTFGETIEFQILANSAPSEAFPFVFDGPLGTFARNGYDGDYSAKPPLVRYNESCMSDFERRGPWARIIATKTEPDMRDYYERNVYQPSLWIPGLDEDGLLCPTDARVPDNSVPLVTLDTGTIISADYSQSGSRASPVIEYEFIREWRQQVSEDPPQFVVKSVVDRVRREYAPAAEVLPGAQVLKIAPTTIRTIESSLDAELTTEVVETAGQQLAREVTYEFERFNAFGPQIVPCRIRDNAVTRALTVGTWVKLDARWIPNLWTLSRGGLLLCLVTSRQKDRQMAWELDLLVRGGAQGGLEQPEIGPPQPGDDGGIEVPVDFPSDYGYDGGGGGGGAPGSGDVPDDADWVFDPSDFDTIEQLKADTTVLFGPSGVDESITGFPEPMGSEHRWTLETQPDGTKQLVGNYNHGAVGCSSITIGIGSVRFAAQQEISYKFRCTPSANFRTTNASCYPNDMKLFFGDTEDDESGRWGVYAGADTYPHSFHGEIPLTPDGFEGAEICNLVGSLNPVNDFWDGQEHEFWVYCKHSTTPTSDDGEFRIYLDGVLIHSRSGFSTCKTAGSGGGAEKANGCSFAHNKDDGPPDEKMTLKWKWAAAKFGSWGF